MRKHNTKFAQRWTRVKGDRSNNPQQMSHATVHSKPFQLAANSLLLGLLHRFIGGMPGTTRKAAI